MLQEYVYELKVMLSIMLPWKQLPGAGRQHDSPKTQIQSHTNWANVLPPLRQ